MRSRFKRNHSFNFKSIYAPILNTHVFTTISRNDHSSIDASERHLKRTFLLKNQEHEGLPLAEKAGAFSHCIRGKQHDQGSILLRSERNEFRHLKLPPSSVHMGFPAPSSRIDNHFIQDIDQNNYDLECDCWMHWNDDSS
ncbi:hypothetical protein VNO77_27700 [Canavalia gladiata]|uniref:Uncharacterized protein n=1 Tax=Canavalia gladiata TaxID=3824 RepID=A0AAN9KYB6_CANGL